MIGWSISKNVDDTYYVVVVKSSPNFKKFTKELLDIDSAMQYINNILSRLNATSVKTI